MIKRVACILMISCILLSTFVVLAPNAHGISGPAIYSVSPITATELQTITITGSGFGNTWPVTAAVGDGSVDTVKSTSTPYMDIVDNGKTQKTGDTSDGGENWAAGVTDFSTVFCMVGIYLVKWSDKEIVLGGFGNYLGTNGQGLWYIEAGDPLHIDVFTSSGEATFFTNVVGVSPVFGHVYTCLRLSAIPSSLYQLSNQPTVTSIIAWTTDQLGNRMPGVTVLFSSTVGTLSSMRVLTDQNGKAQVTLTLGQTSSSAIIATVTATANGATLSIPVTFLPPPTPSQTYFASRWDQATDVFTKYSFSIPVSTYLTPALQSYDMQNLLSQVFLPNLDGVCLNVHLITKASSASQADFEANLTHFFNIQPVPSKYTPIATLIIEYPMQKLFNALFGQDYQEEWDIPIAPENTIQQPGNVILGNVLESKWLNTTPTGNLDFAITFHKRASIDNLSLVDMLSYLAQTIATLAKTLVKALVKREVSPGGLTQVAIDSFKQKIESIGDFSLNVITSDLTRTGSLNSYLLIDLVHAMDYVSTLSGIGLKIVDLLLGGCLAITGTGGGLISSGTGVGAAIGAALDTLAGTAVILSLLDLSLEVIPLLPTSVTSSLTGNIVYQTYQGLVSFVATCFDPNGTTIIPSVYDESGSLFLGYNVSSNEIIYAGSEGMLIPSGGGWLGLLHEDLSSPSNYTVCLNAVGGNASVPYELQVMPPNLNASAIGYTGMLTGGMNVSTLINVSSDGNLTQQTYLDPALTVKTVDGSVWVTAEGLTNEGSPAAVDQAFLTINGSEYQMNPINSSAFDFQIGPPFSNSTPFCVYMTSPDYPGGFACYLGPPTASDVAILDVLPYRSWVYQGSLADINVTVANLGDVMDNVTVDLYFNITSGSEIGIETISLLPNQTETLTFAWNTKGVPLCYQGYNITALADISPEIDSNMTNNVLQSLSTIQVRIIGDILGTGKVDMQDIGIAGRAFGSRIGDVRWNPNCDMNGDGKIDMRDIAIIARNFGQHFP